MHEEFDHCIKTYRLPLSSCHSYLRPENVDHLKGGAVRKGVFSKLKTDIICEG
jgi:hypothetical protein